MRFKSIPFIANVKQKDSAQTVANQLQSILNTQATEGWVFDKIETFTSFHPSTGCFIGIGSKPAVINIYSFVTFKLNDFKKYDSITNNALEVSQYVLETNDTSKFESEEILIEDTIQNIEEPVEIINTPIPSSNFSNLFDISPINNSTPEESLEIIEKTKPSALDWVKKYKVAFGLVVLLLIGVIIYNFLYLPHQARMAGRQSAILDCSNEREKSRHYINQLDDFDRNFYNFNFQVKAEAYSYFSKIRLDESKTNSFHDYDNSKYLINDRLREHYYTGYNEQMGWCDKETYRITNSKNNIEQKINTLPEAYPVWQDGIENAETTLETKLIAKNGSLAIEADVLNVKNQPKKDVGNIVFKVQKGMAFEIKDKSVDDKGIMWYFIEVEGTSGWINGLYTYLQNIEATVNVPQTYFYDLDYNTLNATKRRQYLEQNQTAKVYKKIGDYIYTEYTNTQGITTKGWLLYNDLK